MNIYPIHYPSRGNEKGAVWHVTTTSRMALTGRGRQEKPMQKRMGLSELNEGPGVESGQEQRAEGTMPVSNKG